MQMRSLLPLKVRLNSKRIMLPISEDSSDLCYEDDFTCIKNIFRLAHKMMKPIIIEGKYLRSTLESNKRLRRKAKAMRN